MTEEQAERLVSSLESGHGGIEAFLKLPADDRATIMAMLEQCDADGTMDKIRALLAEHQTKKTGRRSSNSSLGQSDDQVV